MIVKRKNKEKKKLQKKKKKVNKQLNQAPLLRINKRKENTSQDNLVNKNFNYNKI